MSWFSKSKSKRKRKSKSRIVKKRRFTNPEYFLFLFKKIGLSFALIVAIIWLGAWFFLSDASSKTYVWGNKKVANMTASAGYSLKNLDVVGRNFTPAQSIIDAIGLKKSDPLWGFDTEKAQETIVHEDWVQDASVRLIFPNTIKVVIEERIPMALYQKDKQIYLVDSNGLIITDRNLGLFKDLILVSGEGAPREAVALFSNFRAVPQIFYKIERMRFISNRRWDVLLKNETLIKLPEENIALALSSLEKLNNEHNILGKKIDYIDIRDLERISIKTSSGTIKSYNANSLSGGDKI